MIDGKRIAVVMPAYNAEKTLEKTVRALPAIVDIKILVDDSSNDNTARLSEELGVQTFIHDSNYGYGRNQQTCYREALAAGADVVVMVHPDYQYNPALVSAMADMVASGVYDVVLGSRIIGGGALKGGMPRYKYIANRFLTAFQNLFSGSSSPNTTPAFAPFPGMSSRLSRYSKTPMTSSSTIRCSRKPSCLAFALARSPAPQAILRKPLPSTFVVA